MYLEVLTESQIAVLDRLKRVSPVKEFYLAGGTALALRHGHRRSVDFDFFQRTAFDVQNLLLEVESAFEWVERLPTSAETLYVILSGVTTSFFQYPYPLLQDVELTPWGFGLASDSDIAAMKIEAIAGRGSRKDFVDLRLLCQSGMTLETAFDLFDHKYGTGRTERYHRLRALAYFEDAEQEPMPDMLVPFEWDETRRYFTAEASRLLAAGAR